MRTFSAIRLQTDEDLKRHFFDAKKKLFFKERTESVYQSLGEHTLEEVIDATSHGFEFVAVVDRRLLPNESLEAVERQLLPDEIPEEELEFVEAEL